MSSILSASRTFVLLLFFIMVSFSGFARAFPPVHFLTPPTRVAEILDLFAFTGSDPASFSLNPYFSDDQGDLGLVYSVQSNSGDHLLTSITDSMLTLTFPAVHTDTAQLIIRATDIDGTFAQDTFWVRVVAPTVLFRVNAAGAAITATDGPKPNWEADNSGSPSPYRNTGSNAGNTALGTRGAALPAYAPNQLFSQERSDPGAAPEMMWEFPVGTAGVYQVNLFFMNNFGGTSGVGQRVFDVLVEGKTLLDNYDIVADVGHKVATMKTFDVLVTDGVLDIDFGHVVENPLINGIEIVGPPTPPNFGVLTVSKSRLHFLTTTAGSSGAAQMLTLSNTGTDPILLSEATLSGLEAGSFSFSTSLPIILDPGESTPVSVIFSPSAFGIKSAGLEFTHNGSNASPQVVELTGEALPLGALASTLFRVNAGGAATAAADASSPAWAEDQSTGTVSGTAALGTSSLYLLAGGTHTHGTATAAGTDGSLPAQVASSIVQTCREDQPGGSDMAWGFPVDSGHLVLVRMYFAETTAATAGARVFDISVEGSLLVNDLDVFAQTGSNKGTVRAAMVTTFDETLDLLFTAVAGNPMVSAIEVVDLGPFSIDLLARFTIHEGVSDINKSSYGNKSFKIYNDSDPGGNIATVTLDISTGAMIEMVFDPNGTAGDLVPKDFTVDVDPLITGYVSHTLGHPKGNGGYQSVTIHFNNFEPGEFFGFSIDADPTSTEGMPQPGPMDNASVSGLEMVGGTVTVTFVGGSTYQSRLFSDGSNAGVIACLSAATSPSPSLAIEGGGTTLETDNIYLTLQVTDGKPNGTVALLETEAAFFETAPGAQNQLPYETNSLLSMRRIRSIPLDANGEGLIKVTMKKTNVEAGYQIFLVANEENGCFGSASNAVTVRYNPSGDPVRAFYVNTGSTNTYFSQGQEIFGKDEFFTPTPGKKSTANVAMNNTNDDVLFQSDHWDDLSFEYQFPTGNGQVEVTLYFVEAFHNAANKRLFDVKLEGTPILSSFDIWATAAAEPGSGGNGKHFAISRTFVTTVTDGVLNLQFDKGAGIGNPKINAIQVKPVPAAVFPVAWLGELEAKAEAGSVLLSWATASEQNSDRFVVERSREGTGFEEIGAVAAAGTSNEPRQYQLRDNDPGQGWLRYRVRQVDLDGAAEYSNTVEVVNRSQSFNLYPNPANEAVWIELPQAFRTGSLLRILDLWGQEVLSFVVNQQSMVELPLGNLATGTYVVELTAPGVLTLHRRFVKVE